MFFKQILLKFLYLLENWVKSSYFFVTFTMLLSFLSFIKIASDVITKDEITYYDKIIVDFVNEIASKYSDKLATFIKDFGAAGNIAIFLVIFALFLAFKKHYKEIFLVITPSILAAI